MTYLSLKIIQKQAIEKERYLQKINGKNCTQLVLSHWSKKEFNITKLPEKGTISRIFNHNSLTTDEKTPKSCNFRNKKPRHKELDRAIHEWAMEMHHRSRTISGLLIQEKARHLSREANKRLPIDRHITLKFSDGWMS